MTEHDVIVVGAGPVGLAAACLLADAGARVVVVEQAAGPSDLPRAISMVDETFRTLSRIGIADRLAAEANLDTGSRYYGVGQRLLLSSKPASSRTGFPSKSQFDQPVMEQELYRAARMRAGITLLNATEATGLRQDAGTVTLAISGEDGPSELKAPWLIGADGGRSFTREALGIKLEGSTQVERWIVIDLLNERSRYEKAAEFHCDGKRPHVIVPGVGGRLRIEFMLFAHEDANEMTKPDMIRSLAKPFRPDLQDRDVRRASVYVAHRRIAERYRVGRAFLIGDAAHLMPPFAGQGLNTGIRDASNLAWKLAEVIAGRGSDQLLDTYEVERRSHALDMIRISGRIGKVVMMRGRLTRLRDVVIRALSLHPSVRNWLAGMRFIKVVDYSNGVAQVPEPDVEPHLRRLVGSQLPQPRVLLESGERVPLDAALGARWAILCLACDGSRPFEGLDPFWAAIGAKRVVLGTANQSQAEGEIRDLDGWLAEPVARQPTFLLVRPDRYVAAAFTAAGQADLVKRFALFLHAPVQTLQTHGRPALAPSLPIYGGHDA
ncbi:bifunctional 3-(3-hydroxy-phenyl)propionate/3-hydroxycinnamic acid hydroxylase [Rhizobium sp. NZLR1]|uniref:bifunctional 3-(3-hydroxy-phenyl)propionate/3-hydroxycinnamic acid hydroxylase n=1 Tax=Rhizobium sp. NZLR1 TaxID=2731096 RepID=UPI001A981CCD|nr:bifunctional 3-(3-hydroxy-phenyl)propionate/3-hydroxycinnamic acid hydroxylase [Rhizobium sp. NZLR1]MBX5204061.1 bifunctional 3-(3-hydroxy-phenyl)propionate/3-hydroxycinnamic acid hydroxylase [Rhizobium sp. NZLR1]QSZ25142.1 bifunctional 3-(3-hydroxy-phenyl)propionate/3-hydroxycinnamic acid hydroxylase [Rhizobium sp. NZLR1]